MLSRGELEKGGSEEAWPAWKLPECLPAFADRCKASTGWSSSPWHASLVGTCSPGTPSCVEALGVRPPRCKEPFPPGQRKESSTPGSIQFDLYHLAKGPPPLAERLGDLRVVHLRGRLDDLVTLDLAPNHERVHWTLDVVRSWFFVLEI